MPRSLLALLLSCLALCFPACSSDAPYTTGMHYVVSAPQTPFYKFGPAQSMGADFMLPHNARVTMVNNSWGFAKVTTEEGTTGFVATEDLEPAPMLTTARNAPAGLNPSRPSSGRSKPSQPLPMTGSPLFESDLPMPDGPPSPKPTSPNFRF